MLPQRDPAAHAYAKRLLLTTGVLLIPDSTNDRVMAFDPTTGDLVDADFIPSNAVMGTAVNAILGADGESILVSDQINDVVHKFDLDGNYLGIFAPAGGANTAILNNIRGISLDASGNLLVTTADSTNVDAVAKFDTAGNYLGNFIANGAGGLNSPFDIYGRAADWLVASIDTDNILSFDLAGSPVGAFAPISNFPEQITEAGNDNVLVANFGGTEGVYEFTSAGATVGVYDPGTLTGYRGVYELPNGNILTTTGTGVHEISRSNTLVGSKITGISGRFIEYVALQTICTNPADVPWVSEAPTAGTTVAGGSTAVQVTFDSTGLAVGTYTANLCVTSNDPDAGPGNGTDLVVVPLTLNVQQVTQFPNINVSPLSLAATQPANTTTQQTLNVGNTGTADLTWAVAEEPILVPARIAGPLADLVAARAAAQLRWLPTRSSRPQVRAAARALAYSGPNVVLYDQTNNVGTNGFPSQDFEAANDAYDNQGADDFVIPAGDGRGPSTRSTCSARTAPPVARPPRSASSSTRTLAACPERRSYSALGLVPADAAGDFTVALTTPAVLPAGHYWVSVQAVMNFTPLGQWFWSTRSVQSNSPYAWQNPGGGFGTGCTTWANGATVCGVGGGVEPDALFRLAGAIGGATTTCSAPVDVPWLSEAPIIGTVTPGGSMPVQVTFDSTGLAVGAYNANLCVTSNDPDAGPGNGTALVIVPVELVVTEASRCPAGSTEVTVLAEGFEGAFPPAGWVIANNTTGCTPPGVPDWTNTNPGARSNLTGGSGLFAIADSDRCGSGISMDAQMWTPVLDLTGLTAPLLEFKYDYNDLGSADSGALDVSTDGGATWTNAYLWTTDDRGPKTYSGPISGAGENDVIVRWHYIAGWDWWWEVDEVAVTACETVGGQCPGRAGGRRTDRR